jgi:TonB-dependent SusC/RagA subfamily outer membrane receptor
MAGVFAMALVLAIQTGSTRANAQMITSVTNNLNYQYYSVQDYSDAIPELQTIITLQHKQVRMGDVLKEIADKSNLGIAYNSDLSVLDKPINVNVKKATSSYALQTILLGSGYEAAISRNREIILIAQTSEEAVSEEEAIALVSGTVTDAETGEPIPAANVVVVGTMVGTSTDADGEYSLNVPDDSDVLRFSYLGYKTLDVAVNGRSVIDVALEPDLLALGDIVVVGYGTQQRQEVTGAITSVRSEEIQNIPVSSFENALQGRMAGVNVAESTGEPGASPQITIRGTGSISAGNSPLYVIDGVPITTNRNLQSDIGSQRSSFQPPSANPLATINPNDIESIEVLKDASAAAIYGSRGSNGVILITTKQGTAGRTSVNFSSYLGVSNVFNKPDMMNAEELIQYTKNQEIIIIYRKLKWVINQQTINITLTRMLGGLTFLIS